MKKIKTFYKVSGGILTPLNRFPNGNIGKETIMHDLFHHFPDDTGTVEDELRAFGALFYVSNCNFLSVNLHQYDYTRMVYDILNLLHYKSADKLEHCKTSATIDNDEDKECIDTLFKLCNLKDSTYYFNEDIPEPTYHQLCNIFRWIKKGYNQAKRRYIGMLQYEVSDIYYDMLNQINNAKFEDGYTLVEVDIQNANVEVTNLGDIIMVYKSKRRGRYVIKFDYGIKEFSYYETFEAYLKQLELEPWQFI